MPEPTPPDPVEPIRRQVRRLRGRRNGSEAARALLLLIAVAAGAAASVVLLALRAGPRLFAAGAASAVSAALVGALAVLAGTRRRWLARGRAADWIDRRAGLEGRLATLLELAPEGAPSAGSFFLPLLVEENRRRLASWQPAAILPRSVPRQALAAALATTSALALALLLAPALAPTVPEVFWAAGVPDGAGARAAVPGRVLLAPASVPLDVAHSGPPPSRSLAADLQQRIRRRLWGPDLVTASEAMERAIRENARRDGEHGGPASTDEPSSGDPGEGTAMARSDPAAAERAGSERLAGDRAAEDPADEDARRSGRERRSTTDAAAGSGDAARGAGTGTDPRVLGAPTDPRGGAGTFDLPIVARVRSLGGGPRPPAGDAPPATPDARPDLGPGQRRDAPVVRMDVPPAYEPVVRRVFAHPGAPAR